MGFTMGLNILLLVAMVATNILSLYHLSSTSSFLQPKHPPQPPPLSVPSHLLNQLNTIRATINQLTRQHPPPQPNQKQPISSDLLIYSTISPIASSCHDNPHLLHQYMNYTPYSLCPSDTHLAESLILRGCHPLPRRRCFTRTPSTHRLLSDDSTVLWENYPKMDCHKFECVKPKWGFDFMVYKSEIDLTIPQLMDIAKRFGSVIRLGLDIGGGMGDFAVKMKERNVTIVTTTMNLGVPFNEANSIRGVIPFHMPLQQRLPVYDGVIDLVRCGHGVNRWIPVAMMEFLFYDVDRVLRGGGFLWIDHFFSKGVDLENVYKPMIVKLGYKIVKWATGNKMDSGGVKHGEVYLTALLQKPKSR